MKVKAVKGDRLVLEDGREISRSEVRKASPNDDKPEPSTERKPQPPAQEQGQAEPVKFFAYELEAGIATINEIRASKGLPADARFGNMTFPEYRAQNPSLFQTAAPSATPEPPPES